MYQLYAGGCGCVSVANQINAMGARPHRSSAFSRNSVAAILRNPTYIGKVVWDQRTHLKKSGKGSQKHVTIRNPREKWTVTDGLHPPIVEQALYNKVQDIMAGRYRPADQDGTTKSPLAGLVFCANCGGHMQRMTFRGTAYLVCPRKGCCAAAKFDLVEARLLGFLKDILGDIAVERPAQSLDLSPLEEALSAFTRELSAAHRQKTRLHELLELGEYDLPTYRERMDAVREKIAQLELRREETAHRLEQAQSAGAAARKDRPPSVLEVYAASSPAGRNAILHAVIDAAYYRKTKKTRPAAFSLELVLKPL